jgi:hypothetical protein
MVDEVDEVEVELGATLGAVTDADEADAVPGADDVDAVGKAVSGADGGPGAEVDAVVDEGSEDAWHPVHSWKRTRSASILSSLV